MWSGRGSSSAELPAALGNQQPFSHGIGCSTGLGLVRRHKLPGLKHHGNTAPVGLSQESSWSCTDISGYRSESLTLDPSRPGVLCYSRLASTSRGPPGGFQVRTTIFIQLLLDRSYSEMKSQGPLLPTLRLSNYRLAGWALRPRALESADRLLQLLSDMDQGGERGEKTVETDV